MSKFIDLTGQQFSAWQVIKHDQGRYWICKCMLCNNTVKSIHASSLKSGSSKSCGCQHTNNRLKEDLTGRTFGNWKVLSYAEDGNWVCECQCNNKTIKIIARANLVLGKTKSCGCLRRESSVETLLNRYGETAACKVNNPRTEQQIQLINNKELLCKFILDTFGCNKPTFTQLAKELNVSRHRISVKIHEYNLENLININPLQSNEELELIDFIKSITDSEIVTQEKDIIHPYELDIYIPDKQLALEFNGTYWHSTEKIPNKKYHQNKTILCAEKGIQLIHVFEYEWKDEIKKEKIKKHIYNLLNKPSNIIYARNAQVVEINNSSASVFYKQYHLQDSVNSEINVALCINDKVIGVMSFGVPRFNSEFHFELTRLCFSNDCIIIGGAEKLFNYFIKRYNPESIISYCDISKFKGRVYTRLGFKPLKKAISEPNYVWVTTQNNIVLTRYQTQKHKLIKAGLGNENQTEDEIMQEIGFYKVYDSGNLRLAWYRGDKS